MNELEIMNNVGLDVTKWDFDSIKSELESRLADYAELVYTDDNIKVAKGDRATLRKVKKKIEEARKDYKKKCMEPYEAMEPKLKELVQLVDKQDKAIDHVVKEYEERQKEEKEEKIRKYYDRKAVVLGDMAWKLYDEIFDPKWLNASTSKAKYEEEIQVAIDEAARDIEEIKGMNSPFVKTLLDTYADTMSMEDVIDKERELSKAVEMANLKPKQAPAPEQPAAEVQPVNDEADADGKNGRMIRIYADDKKLKKLTDFMRAIGVQYELL